MSTHIRVDTFELDRAVSHGAPSAAAVCVAFLGFSTIDMFTVLRLSSPNICSPMFTYVYSIFIQINIDLSCQTQHSSALDP